MPDLLSCRVCGHIDQPAYRHPASDHNGRIVVLTDAGGDEHWFEVAGDDDTLTVTVDGVPVLGVDRRGPGFWPDGETWMRIEEVREQLDHECDESVGCTCCDSYGYRDRPPEGECLRCGHLYRNHKGE